MNANINIQATKIDLNKSKDDMHLEYNQYRSESSFSRASAQRFKNREDQVKYEKVKFSMPKLN